MDDGLAGQGTTTSRSDRGSRSGAADERIGVPWPRALKLGPWEPVRVLESKMSVHRSTTEQWIDPGVARSHRTGDSMHETMRRDETPSDLQSGQAEELRAAPRFTLLIRAAKLTASDTEFLCVVRDASETGISVRLFHPLPADVPLTLELPNGDRHPLERVWEAEGKAGFRFVEAVSIERIVESPSRFAKRAVRVNLQVPCDLWVGGRCVSAQIKNLSQTGALVTTTERLSLIQRVKIRAEGMPEVAAKVRWRRQDDYGLSFEDTFQFAELAALAFELQRTA